MKAVVAVAAFFGAVLWQGYVFAHVWSWHIHVGFEVDQRMATAAFLLVALMRTRPVETDTMTDEHFYRAVGFAFIHPALILFTAYIFTLIPWGVP